METISIYNYYKLYPTPEERVPKRDKKKLLKNNLLHSSSTILKDLDMYENQQNQVKQHPNYRKVGRHEHDRLLATDYQDNHNGTKNQHK